MSFRRTAFAVLLVPLISLAGPVVVAQTDDEETPSQFTFTWQFEPHHSMRPRGGTTTGTAVELLEGASADWLALNEPDLTKFERDRRAILAMAGGYRTSFEFLETVGFTSHFEPARPYRSWSTEYVYVVEDEGPRISLQHVIVMYYQDADGETQGPVVQKHWRQDWQYEDRSVHAFVGRGRWREQVLEADAVTGRWSQAVYQVDDSPRYEALGDWVHNGNYSAWTSDETWRPLPRRESSVRDDYDVLIGTNRHTITPTGWVQEEENLKVVLDEASVPAGESPYVARELGLNRYERIIDFDFAAGDEYWETTQDFWADVRSAWAQLYEDRTSFRLAGRIDSKPLFQLMFEFASDVEDSGSYNRREGRAFIDAALEKYVR